MKFPDVYIFNPTCEMAVANDTVSWQPNRFLKQFETDLDLLPIFLCEKTDYVVVGNYSDNKLLKELEQQGFSIPQLILAADIVDSKYARIRKNALKPWGWSKVIHHKFKGWKKSWSEDFRNSSVFEWSDKIRQLYSRKTALKVLQGMTKDNPELFSEDLLPVACESIEELYVLHHKNGKSMVKAPWSSSGRGVCPVCQPQIDQLTLQWCTGVLRQQKFLMVEPLLNRILDFAFQFEYKNGRAHYLGISWFFTDDQGKYQGNWLKCPERDIEKEIIEVIEQHEDDVVALLKKHIGANFESNYEGFLGVDAMIFRSACGQLFIHPCVEINVRMNMGILAMNLAKKVGETFDVMRIVNRAQEESLKPAKKRLRLTHLRKESLFYAELVKF